MKKILFLLIVCAVCLSCFACSSYSSAVGTITDNDGNTHEVSARDICKQYKKSEELYDGAKITIEMGEVVEVDVDTKYFDANPDLTETWYEITILGGWVVQVTETAHPEAETIDVGDIITVESAIQTATEEFVYLDTSHYIDHWEDSTSITIHNILD